MKQPAFVRMRKRTIVSCLLVGQELGDRHMRRPYRAGMHGRSSIVAIKRHGAEIGTSLRSARATKSVDGDANQHKGGIDASPRIS